MKPRGWVKSEESMVFSFRKLMESWGIPEKVSSKPLRDAGLVPDKRPGLRGKGDVLRLLVLVTITPSHVYLP